MKSGRVLDAQCLLTQQITKRAMACDRSGAEGPVVPSADPGAHLLHRKAAEAVKRTHGSLTEHVEFRVEEDGNHGDDLMTPPELLLQRALREANQLTREKEGAAAVEQWVRAAALSRVAYGDAHWEFARCHVRLGQAYLELRDLPKQALTHATKGRDLLLAPGVAGHVTPHDPPPEAVHCLATAHCIVGRVLTIQSQLAGAERSLVEAEHVSQRYSKMPQTGGPDSNLDLDIVSALGRLCMKQTKYGKAQAHFAKAVTLAREVHGAKDTSLIPILKLQSQAELEGGMYSRAAMTLQEALEIAESSDGLESKLAAGVLLGLAHVHETNSKPDAAENLFQRAHEIFCATLGENHPRALSCKEDFCRFLISRPNSQERVVEMLREVISGKKRTFGDQAIEVAHSYKLLGSVYLSQGKVDPAKKCLATARDVYSGALGVGHRETVAIVRTLEIIAGSSESGQQLQDRPPFRTVV